MAVPNQAAARSFAAAVLACASIARAQVAAERPLPPDHRATSLALAKIASEHPELASIVPVGTSRAGRKIEALRLAAGELAPGRPALLIVANVEGPYAWTTGLALDEARELGARYALDGGLQFGVTADAPAFAAFGGISIIVGEILGAHGVHARQRQRQRRAARAPRR